MLALTNQPVREVIMADSILPIKPCKKCGASNRYPSGKCKPCGDLASKKYRQDNIEKARGFSASWYLRNKERSTATRLAYRAANIDSEMAYMRAYQVANKERIAATQAEYRRANKAAIKARDAEKYRQQTEKCKALNKAWYASNPDAVRVKNQNRRAKVKSSEGTLTKGRAYELLSLQRGKCACCGKPLGDKYHLDHIMPLALGGLNVDSNVQLLRAECNLQKHAADPIDFMQGRGFLL